MMRLKKIVALLASLCMMLNAVPLSGISMPEKSILSVSAAETGTYESLNYTKYDDHVEITGYSVSIKRVVIPSEIDGLPVTSIKSEVFKKQTSMTSITIPNTVTSISYSAFQDCTGLESIEIPDSVIEIGDNAFYRCNSLSSVVIPNSVTTMGSSVFGGCTALTSITLPENITRAYLKTHPSCII